MWKYQLFCFHCPIHYIFYSSSYNHLSSNTHDSNKPVISLKFSNLAWFWGNLVSFYFVSGKTDSLICMVLESLKSPKATCSSVRRKNINFCCLEQLYKSNHQNLILQNNLYTSSKTKTPWWQGYFGERRSEIARTNLSFKKKTNKHFGALFF